jgi:hypothetical protein
MTRYAIDEARSELLATWNSGYGAVAVTVAGLPESVDARQRLNLADELSGLSKSLWRCYTHPASAADSIDVNTEGWRRQQTRDGFSKIVRCIRRPNLPHENGSLIVSYDPVEERANRVGRVLHTAADPELTAAVITDVETEINAVENAELGDLSGRSVQAVHLTRQDASPVQVAAADQILARNPLGGEELFLELDPTSACVAAAHWLKAAADVTSAVSGQSPSRIVLEADNIEAIPVTTPTDILELLDAGWSPTDAVTTMIRDAMAVADGKVPNIDAIREKINQAEQSAEKYATDPTSRLELLRVQLTPLDPKRPARDMLEDLLTGIRGCWLLYYEYADRPYVDSDEDDDETLDEIDEETETDFCNEVRAEATSKRHRLALEPAPAQPTRTDLREEPNEEVDEAEEDTLTYDLDLEADDTCEQLVAAILDSEEPDLPRQIIESVAALEHDGGGRLLALLIAHGVRYLVTMKEKGVASAELDAAVDWIGREFGTEYAGPAAVVAGLAGHRESQRTLANHLNVEEPTFEQLSDFLGSDLFPAIIWLCTGLVVTVGGGDPVWLRPYGRASG